MSYTLISNGTLINGNGGNPIENAAVLINDHLIVAAGLEKINENSRCKNE